MDIPVQQINDITDSDIYIRYENDHVRQSIVFQDFLSMDGEEVSTAIMCPTTQCMTCWCPSDESDATVKVYLFQYTQEVHDEVELERKQRLKPDGKPQEW